MDESSKKAAGIVKNGGIMVFPTDTAFGIGCRIDDFEAVKKLFTIRRRSTHKATPVLVSNTAMAREWVDALSIEAHGLIETYWPGGLTLVLPSHDERVAPLVKGGTDTLGVRMPDHPELLQVIDEVGVPIIGSSANFEGGQTPFRRQDLDPELVAHVDFIMEGECSGNESSTVVDCTNTPLTILREGAVKIQF